MYLPRRPSQACHYAEQLAETVGHATFQLHAGTPLVHCQLEQDNRGFAVPYPVRERRVHSCRRELQGTVYGIYPAAGAPLKKEIRIFVSLFSVNMKEKRIAYGKGKRNTFLRRLRYAEL